MDLLPPVSRLAIAIALSALSVAAAYADVGNRELLSAFCASANIKGANCSRAKNYPNGAGRRCNVELTGDRYRGRFIAGGNPLLIANYQSGCEAHVTGDGGVAVFEEIGNRLVFKAFVPGMQGSECLTVAKDAKEDLLICLTGHMGQGHLETRLARTLFKPRAGNAIALDFDFLLQAEDTIGAYEANVVTCKDPPPKYFGLDKLRAGPRPLTVTVEASYADAHIINTACSGGFPKPQDDLQTPAEGDAFVPEGSERKGSFVVDLVTRKVEPVR